MTDMQKRTKAELIALLEACEAEKAALAAALAEAGPVEEPIATCTFNADCGQFVVGGAGTIGPNWCNRDQARGGWFVDFHGPNAAYLVRQHRTLPHVEIEPDFWRLTVKAGRREAEATASQAERWLRNNDAVAGNRVEARPVSMSEVLAEDATRATGAGVFKGRMNGKIGAVAGSVATVEIFADRKVITIT